MQVALLLTGFYRSFDKTRDNLLGIAKDLKADVFVATWDKDEWNTNKGKYNRAISMDMLGRPQTEGHATGIWDIEHYMENRVPFVQNNRDQDVMVTDPRAREHGLFWANRLRDQWYLVQRGFELIHYSTRKYDAVIRVRMDIAFDNFVFRPDLVKSDLIVIPQDIGGWDYSDHLAYGSYATMEKYCTFFQHMQNVYDIHNTDPTHAVNFPKFYMTQYGEKRTVIIDQTMRYSIIKP